MPPAATTPPEGFSVTPARLRLLAGEESFDLGQRWHADGAIAALEVSTSSAKVTVTVDEQDFPVELRFGGRALEGACDCPASGGFDFCGHCVAAALALDAHTKALVAGADDDRLLAFLRGLPQAKLVDELGALVRADKALKKHYLTRAEVAAKGISARTLRKELTSATRPRDIWQYAQVRKYFETIDLALDHLDGLLGEVPGSVMLEVCEYGFERIDKALERVDDSGGFRFPTIEKLKRLYGVALESAALEIGPLTKRLAGMASGESWFESNELIDLARRAGGEDAVDELFATVQRNFDALPAAAADQEHESAFEARERYRGMAALLATRAAEAGDIDAQIAILEKSRADWTGARDRAALYLSKGDTARAQALLEEANQLAARRVDDQLQVDIHLAADRAAAAIALLFEQFANSPTLALHQRLMMAAAQDCSVNAVRQRADEMLADGIANHGSWLRQQFVYAQARIRWEAGDAAGALAAGQLLVDEQRLLKLATLLRDIDPIGALGLSGRAAEAATALKTRRGYRRAVAIIDGMVRTFGSSSPEGLAQWLEAFETRHSRKVGLMNLLSERRAVWAAR